MVIEESIKGPASYCPSIEKKYGKPVAHWFNVLHTLQDLKHREQVAYLKHAHAMGHGHADALAAHQRAPSGG